MLNETPMRREKLSRTGLTSTHTTISIFSVEKVDEVEVMEELESSKSFFSNWSDFPALMHSVSLRTALGYFSARKIMWRKGKKRWRH